MVEDINELSGLIRTHPMLTMALSLLIFSVAGLPPLAGFWPKLAILQAAIEGGYLWLAIILVLSSVIAAGYYLRVIYVMWVKDASERFEESDMSVRVVLAVTALSTLVFLVFIGRLDEAAQIAAAGWLS